MRKINRSMHEIVQDDDSALLSKTERKRYSASIAQVLCALAFLVAAQIYNALVPAQQVIVGLIYLCGTLVVGIPVFMTGVRGFLQKEFSSAMEILVSIAMIISVLNNEYVVAILIPLLLMVVHFFEEKSIMGGRDAIEGLKKMQATSAVLLKDGKEVTVDAKALKKGDTILIRPGMALPIDGTVIKGTSSINQQSLTGESMPCMVQKGDSVYGGTLNLDGELTVRVEKEFADTSFQKIVNLLEESENGSTSESRIIDRVLAYYIPIALIVATITWLFTKQIDRAVAILVVSCPCGHMLVNSAPMIAALSVATKRGVLIKNTSFIETLSQVDTVFLDKTGTITNGNIQVEKCVPCEGVSEAEVYKTALAVATRSRHPLSMAIAALQNHFSFEDDYDISERGGMGVIGKKGSDVILLGTEAWLSSQGIAIDPAVRQETTCDYVAKNGKLLGVVCFSDTLRHNAQTMVSELHKQGVQEVSLLTGDRAAIAQRYQELCGLTSVHAQLLPEQKQQIVSKAKEEKYVAFVGDGINDALALSASDVGIAMGAMGVDAAIQSADIALMNENLDNIPFAFFLAKETRKVIYQNMVIAFVSSFVMISLAALGIMPALPGALLHNIGAFLVLFNSARLIRMEMNKESEEKKNLRLQAEMDDEF